MDGFCFCQRILPPRWLYQVPQTRSCSWHPLSWCTDTIFKMTTFVFEIYENLQRNPLSLCLYFVVTWHVLNIKRFSENCFGIISQWTGFYVIRKPDPPVSRFNTDTSEPGPKVSVNEYSSGHLPQFITEDIEESMTVSAPGPSTSVASRPGPSNQDIHPIK